MPPIEISNLVELQEIELDLDADYVIVNDIDASDSKNWNPMPEGHYFVSTFVDTGFQYDGSHDLTIEFEVFPVGSTTWSFGTHRSDNSPNRCYIRTNYAIGMGGSFSSTNINTPLKEWSKFILTVNQTTNQAVLYKDGSQIATLSFDWVTTNEGNTPTLYIGGHNDDGLTQALNGVIKNVQIFDYIRDSGDFNKIMPPDHSGLLHQFNIDEGLSSFTSDRNYLQFDGTDSYVDIPLDVGKNMGGQEVITTETLVKKEANNKRQDVFYTTREGTLWAKYLVSFNDDNTLRLGVRSHPNDNYETVDTVATYTDTNEWLYIKTEADVNNKTLRIWVNDDLVAERTSVSFANDEFGDFVGDVIFIGNSGNEDYPFNGKIAHFEVYSENYHLARYLMKNGDADFVFDSNYEYKAGQQHIKNLNDGAVISDYQHQEGKGTWEFEAFLLDDSEPYGFGSAVTGGFNRMYIRSDIAMGVGDSWTAGTNLNMPKGRWVHIALVFDEDNTAEVYVDGQQRASMSFDWDDTLTSNLLFFSAYNLNGAIEREFNGYIRNTAIWDSKKAIGDIGNFELTGSEPGLIRFYPMIEGSGKNTYDIVDNAQAHLVNLEWDGVPMTGFLEDTSWGMDINTKEIEGTTHWFTSFNEGFTPIGDLSNKFNGSFDGQNYTISDLYIYHPTLSNIGMFGFISTEETWETSCEIQNIRFNNSDVTGRVNVGTLTGRAEYGTHINNIQVTNGYVHGKEIGDSDAGGIAGIIRYDSVTISNSSFQGEVYGHARVGGILGFAFTDSLVENCFFNGTAYGNDEYVGGIAGRMRSNAEIRDSYATGNVFGMNRGIGGLVGINRDSYVFNSYSTAVIETPLIVSHVGGGIGRHFSADGEYSEVSNSFADSNINPNLNFIGEVFDVGTIVIDNAEMKTTAEMKRYSTYKYSNWDIEFHDTEDEADGYPFLSWEID